MIKEYEFQNEEEEFEIDKLEKEEVEQWENIEENTVGKKNAILDGPVGENVLLEETIEKNHQCLYYMYGNLPIQKKNYYCILCDPPREQPICDHCFKICHQECKSKIKTKKTSNQMEGLEMDELCYYVLEDEFLEDFVALDEAWVCACGKVNKHMIKQQNIEEAQSKCFLGEEIFKGQTYFYCMECKGAICPFCESSCHCNHSLTENLDMEAACECKDGCHKTNETVFQLQNTTSPFYSMRECKNRLLNVFLQTPKSFSWFFEFIQNIITSNASKKTFLLGQLILNKIENNATGGVTLPVLHSNIVNNNNLDSIFMLKNLLKFNEFIHILNDYFTDKKQVGNYYNPKILTVIPYHETCDFIINILYPDNCNRFELFQTGFDLILAIKAIHFKSDFKFSHSFKFRDFLATSILERAAYKENFFKRMDQGLKDKYFPTKSWTLADFIIKFTELASTTVKEDFYSEKIETYTQCYQILLQFISYTLKLMIYNREELLKLTKNLIDLFELIHLLCKYRSHEDWLYNNFSECNQYFFKIILMILISYNDIVVCDYFTNSNMPQVTFLQENREYGEKILKMVLRLSVGIIRSFFKSESHISKKYFDIYIEILKIFGLSRNAYSSQIENLNWVNVELEVSKISHTSPTENPFHRLWKELNGKLEEFLIPNSAYVIAGSLNYNLNLEDVLKSYDFKSILKPPPVITEQKKTPLSFSHYQTKVIKYFEQVLGIKIDRYEDYSHISQDLIDSKLESFAAYYFWLIRKNQNDRDVEIILAFLSLFFLNSSSFAHFCQGSTITKCFLCLKQFLTDAQSKSGDSGKSLILRMQFFHLVVTGFSVYSIDLSNHKAIPMLVGFKDLKLKTLEQKMIILHIFTDLLHIFEHEDFEQIKANIFTNYQEYFSNDNVELFKSLFNKKTGPQTFEEMKVEIEKIEIPVIKPIVVQKEKTSDQIYTKNINTKTPEEKCSLLTDEKDENSNNKKHGMIFLKENKIPSISSSKDETEIRIVSKKTATKIKKPPEHKFYFNFLELLTHNSFFIFDHIQQKERVEKIGQFLDLPFLKANLIPSVLTLMDRSTLLKILRTIYFVFRYQNISKMKHTKKAYAELFNVTDIFIQEYDQLELIIFSELNFDYIKLYLTELVYSTKLIEDFAYHQKKAWARYNWYIYKLTKRFILKKELIQNILAGDRNEGPVLLKLYLGNIKPLVTELEYVDFDFQNKKLIYQHFAFHFQSLLSQVSLYDEFEFSKFVMNFDDLTTNDFHSLGLIHTEKNFEDFYSNRPSTSGDVQLKKQKLLASYFNPYINFPLSNFYKVISTVSTNESENYVQKISELFIGYVCTDYLHSDDEKRKLLHSEKTTLALFTLLSKMLFFATEKAQNSLKMLKPEKEKPRTNEEEKKNEEKPNEQENDIKQHEDTNVSKIEEDDEEEVARVEHKYEENEDEENEEEKDPDEKYIQELFSKKKYNITFFLCIYKKIRRNFLLLQSASQNFLVTKRQLELSILNQSKLKFLTLLSERFNTDYLPMILNIQLPNNEEYSIYELLEIQYKKALKMLELTDAIKDKIEINQYKMIVVFTSIVDFFIEYSEFEKCIEKISFNIFTYSKFPQCFIQEKKEKEKNSIDNPNARTLCNILLLKLKMKYFELLNTYIQITQNQKPNLENELEILVENLPWTDLFEEIMSYFKELIKKLSMIPTYEKTMKELFTYRISYFLAACLDMYKLEEKFEKSIELTLCIKIFTYLKKLHVLHAIGNVHTHFRKYTTEEWEKIEKRNTNLSGLESVEAYKIYTFFSNIQRYIYVKMDQDPLNPSTNLLKPVFFIRPAITLFLSERTKHNFAMTADRDNRVTKLTCLVKEVDYFIFEMLYNAAANSFLRKITEKMDYSHLEIVNYLFVIAHQIILMVYYFPYNGDEITYDDKYQIPPGNMILAIIQLFYLTLVIIAWFICHFKLSLQHNVMKIHGAKLFIGKGKKMINTADTENFSFANSDSSEKKKLDPKQLTENSILEMKKFPQFKIGLLYAVILNKDINIFFLTLFILIIYLSTGSAILLALLVFLIVNFVKILRGIVQAIQLKWFQLLIILIFTYLCIYFFSWITFYFYYPLFDFDTLDYVNNIQITENHCSNAIQCYLTLIDFGFRSGGGIGEELPQVSMKTSSTYYIATIFYTITFHIFIILILGNIFFGIVVDAFSDLRDKTDRYEEDVKNCCFICNLTMERSINQNIKFDFHIKRDHNQWNFVYFMTYLRLNDRNLFNKVEFSILRKWSKGYDITWFPGENDQKNLIR